MKKGMTKQINIFFKFDELGNVIKGDVEGTNDSRFLGVTFFNEYGEKSTLDGKSPVIKVKYVDMTEKQKLFFDDLTSNYVILKDDE
jgi:hypothetical protein